MSNGSKDQKSWPASVKAAYKAYKVNCSKTRMSISIPISKQQGVCEVGNVAGCQAKRLNFGELSVHRLSGYESPERSKCTVDTLGTVALSSIGCAPLFHYENAAATRHPGNPPAFVRGEAASIALVRATIAFTAVFLILGHHTKFSIAAQMGRHWPQHGKCQSFKRFGNDGPQKYYV
ncbi:hypothetical protein UPYG_G00006700 [Umbra pygmaea]|uniref:Uncharacterized protein n=1 Tax=Umbra pygmaea TaxID=75934 RepID=A0ABD0XKD1_UMBPY